MQRPINEFKCDECGAVVHAITLPLTWKVVELTVRAAGKPCTVGGDFCGTDCARSWMEKTVAGWFTHTVGPFTL